VVVITGGPEAKTVREYDRTAVQEFASVTCAVKENVPAIVGVPLSVPLFESVRPPGLRNIVQEYGGLPPVAVRFWEYGIPTVAAGRLEVITTFPTVSV